MGIISLEQKDCLYWLGRYTERVYSTLRLFSSHFDQLIDTDVYSYEAFCRRLEIPNIYESGWDFVERYCFDENNPDSIYSNLMRAHDNAIILREEIGSESLAYIQLAVYEIQRAHGNKAPLIALQKVTDNIVAFWGMSDDSIDDWRVRSILKTGRRVERVDIYARLKASKKELKRAVARLDRRISEAQIAYNAETLEEIKKLVDSDTQPDFDLIVRKIESILEV